MQTKIEPQSNGTFHAFIDNGTCWYGLGVHFESEAHAQRVLDAITETTRQVHIVVWTDYDGINAQAYVSREAAVRDYPAFDESDRDDSPWLVESTVQA